MYNYVHKRDLPRPRYALVLLAGALALNIIAVVGCGILAVRSGIGHPWLVGTLAGLAVTLRWTVMAAVKTYQRYAPDEVRRECVLMPTCSEYCLMAVRKYGAMVGGAKTLHRLLFKCKHNAYCEDWP